MGSTLTTIIFIKSLVIVILVIVILMGLTLTTIIIIKSLVIVKSKFHTPTTTITFLVLLPRIDSLIDLLLFSFSFSYFLKKISFSFHILFVGSSMNV